MKKIIYAICFFFLLIIISGCGTEITREKISKNSPETDHLTNEAAIEFSEDGFLETNDYFVYLVTTIDEKSFVVVDNPEGENLFRLDLSNDITGKLIEAREGNAGPFFESYEDNEGNIYFYPSDEFTLQDGRSVIVFANNALIAIDFDQGALLGEVWMESNDLYTLSGVEYSDYIYVSGTYEGEYLYIGIVDLSREPFVFEDLSKIEGSSTNGVVSEFDGLERIEWLEDGTLMIRFIDYDAFDNELLDLDLLGSIYDPDFNGDPDTLYEEYTQSLKDQYPEYEDIKCYWGMNDGCYGLNGADVYQYDRDGLRKVEKNPEIETIDNNEVKAEVTISSNTTNSNDWNHYTNQVYGFTFEYPKDFFLEDGDDLSDENLPSRLLFSGLDLRHENDNGSVIFFQIFSDADSLDLEEYILSDMYNPKDNDIFNDPKYKDLVTIGWSNEENNLINMWSQGLKQALDAWESVTYLQNKNNPEEIFRIGFGSSDGINNEVAMEEYQIYSSVISTLQFVE